MEKLTTFEDIFNKLIEDYQEKNVEISIKQDGFNISNFLTTIDRVIIEPLKKTQPDDWNSENEKIGLIIIQEKKGHKYHARTKIPFILGFDTMSAVFLKNGVTIKTFNMKFNIKKYPADNRKLA